MLFPYGSCKNGSFSEFGHLAKLQLELSCPHSIRIRIAIDSFLPLDVLAPF